jgi:hypothetical protein
MFVDTTKVIGRRFGRRHSILRRFQAAFLAGLLVGTATLDFDYGLGAFVMVFLGFGGWEFLTERRG